MDADDFPPPPVPPPQQQHHPMTGDEDMAVHEEVRLDIESDGDLLSEFISEAREHLAEVEQGVLALESAAPSSQRGEEAMRTIFRAFHSFKGVAGYLNLAPIHNLAHEVESVLDAVRHGAMAVDAPITQLVLESKDVLERFVRDMEMRLQNPAESAVPIRVATSHLELRARAILTTPASAMAEPEPGAASGANPGKTLSMSVSASTSVSTGLSTGGTESPGNSAQPAPSASPAAPDASPSAPASAASPTPRPLPPLFASTQAARPPQPGPGPQAPGIPTAADPTTIRPAAAAAAEPDATRHPLPPGPAQGPSAPITPATALPGAPEDAQVPASAPEAKDQPQAAPSPAPVPAPEAEEPPVPFAYSFSSARPAGGSPSAPGPVRATSGGGSGLQLPLNPGELHGQAPAPTPAGASAPSPAPAAAPASAADVASDANQGTTRVDVARLDMLVEYVRELSVVHSLVGQSIRELGVKNNRLTRQLAQMQRLSRELQRTSMAMRLVPMSGLFRRMQRVVRDLARRENKQINLILSGDDTELDRTLVEQLADPLTHMVRNAVDHGIEAPERRMAAGKSPAGTLRIEARHAGSQVVVRIADDGAGLDRNRILIKGIERGLVPPTAVLEAEEIDQLIFAPGFSTADVITDISGRGVGLDVVRQHIDNLRGQIDIETEAGKGTAFIITLPLTTSILDGMIVTIGAQRFIIPSPSVLRTFRPTPPKAAAEPRGDTAGSDAAAAPVALPSLASPQSLLGEGPDDTSAAGVSIHTDGTVYEMEGSRIAVIDVRGKLIPLVRVAEVLGIEPLFRDATQGLVVLVEAEGREVALLVDRVIGKQEVVIKPLGETFRRNEFFAGASLLSDGILSLVLNILAIARHTSRLHEITERRAQEQRWQTATEGGDVVI
ncbi:hypothetical protein DB346_02020 [Verrucomicrobia bacterium LW23]|nr:hypothetical protein DB346_02020 [Verrucomicrobia bacterium LW23]